MPLQGLNLDEYKIEGVVTAPRRRESLRFQVIKGTKSHFFSSVSYLPDAWRDFRLAFRGGGGQMTWWPPLLGFWGGMAGLPPPPGSASVWKYPGQARVKDHAMICT